MKKIINKIVRVYRLLISVEPVDFVDGGYYTEKYVDRRHVLKAKYQSKNYQTHSGVIETEGDGSDRQYDFHHYGMEKAEGLFRKATTKEIHWLDVCNDRDRIIKYRGSMSIPLTPYKALEKAIDSGNFKIVSIPDAK